ncbi:hypothetical protein [Nisaea sediminum]|uniref:hypothetical protein n=1 Tax=Nisaea sediminum TaxID=2775867 RepID=UPI001867D596|nr:hypothetical protein [Nisaea sediminum]
MIRRWAGPTLLFLLGILQMTGDLAGSPVAKAIGAATAASPAPKVFTAHEGFETYSSTFHISWFDRSGTRHELQITPETYGGVVGPYNRRNAYGAALSYAPVLQSNPMTRPLHDSAIRYTFCGSSKILEEIGIDRTDTTGVYTVLLRPRQILPSDHYWRLSYEVDCRGE